ncbi:hypothetical protein [Prochlorococcus sp. MIT 1307]|uniref:hypothetical protein n=1 Tax=Prochlorococcus sp. MIT 1307 TaxID=3096219 RepID=UPI002A74FDF2|nr:hypothetical protein [Prochlorococcus sp. MIT 1307]
MGPHWRYPLDKNLHKSEILAEIVAHAITRIEVLEGKDKICVLAEYKEWLGDNFNNDVLVLHHLKRNS